MQPAVPGGCWGGGSLGPATPSSAWGRLRASRLRLPLCGLAWARLRGRPRGCFVAELDLTSGSGQRSPGRAGGGFPLPWVPSTPGGRPRGVSRPCVGAVFSRAGVGRAGAPAGREGTGCSRRPGAVPGEGKGERDPTGTAAGGGRGQAAVSPTPYGASAALRRCFRRVATEQEGGVDGSPGLPGSQHLWGAT